MNLLTLLLQTTDTLVTPPVLTPTVETAGDLNLWELACKGGIIMIPLLLLSLLSIYIFFERLQVIRRAAREDNTFMERIKDYIHEGDILVAIENVGNIEIAKLEKGFPWLATTAAGAPMLGFLGTVTGMVRAFYNMASAGNNADISTLSGGIYEALVTTVAGLIVGIIALFAYNYLISRVDGVMNQLEAKTMEFMDLLNEPAE